MTRQTVARLVLAVVFVGLLATPYLMRRFGPRAAPAAPAAGVDARAQYGFRLTESAKAAGLDFVHEAPTLDAKLAHIMPQVASMGAAVVGRRFRCRWPSRSVCHQQPRGIREPVVQESRRRHVRGRRRAVERRRSESSRDRRVDGLGVGRLRQRRLRGPADLSLGPRGAVPQRRRTRLHARDRRGESAALGEHQHRRVVRLRSRRADRHLHGRLLSGDASISGSSPTRR